MNRHLENTNMTYWQHWCFAMCHAKCCCVCAVKLFVHAWMPNVFTTAGTDLVCKMKSHFDCE
jgi:hypothetical protein